MNIPAYIKTSQKGALESTARKFSSLLESCCLCPRRCAVNRLKNNLGFCKTGMKAKVCSFMPHHGEEPPLSGTSGSGTIFFSHCNMACAYCQNYEFSQLGQGKELESEELAGIMIRLQESGCHNINLVTPSHVIPQILQALLLAIPLGLKIPLCYNTSGYDSLESIRLLDGIMDIYLADMRYADKSYAEKYSSAADYPQRNQEAVKEMHRQVGILKTDDKGVAQRGLIIRHLVLPNKVSGTTEIMRFIAEELSPQTYISLMSQYVPYYRAKEHKEISRKITLQEYAQAQETMHSYGLYNGWTQDAHGLERFAGTNIKPNI